MAVISTTSDEEEQGQQAKAPVSSVSTGGGGVGGGKASTGPVPGGSPAQSANPQQPSTNPAGTFTNLQNYVNENPSAGTNLGNQISGKLTGEYNAGENAIQQGTNQFNTDVTAGTPQFNSDFVNSALSNPSDFASNPANVTAFQSELTPTYTGPTSLQNDYTAFNDINQGVGNAQAAGTALSTPAGIETALSSNAAPGSNQTAGDFGLNNFFIQSSPTAVNNIQQAETQLSGLPGQVTQAETQAGPTVANAQAATANTGTQTANAVQNAYTGLEGNINSAVTADQAQAQTNLQALQTALATNQPLTQAQITQLGLTPAQYQALQTLANQYGTAINPANNLALVGAENLTQNGSAASLVPTGTTQTAPGGLLSSLANTASSVISGAELAALINTPGAANTTLSSIGLGSIAQSLGINPAGTISSLSVPQEQSIIEDLPVDSNLGLDTSSAATNALDVGNTATSVGDVSTASDATDAASGAASYLPYVGAALSVYQILSTGEIGNGQGGLSGALSGAGEGAAIGTAIYPGIGTAVGAVLGAILGGLMGSTPTVGPNGYTGISVNPQGQLYANTANSGADNGASVATTNQVAEQSVAVINQLMASNNLMLNPKLNGQDIAAIVQGNAGTDNIGQANSAAGLWAVLIQNGAIVPNPNGTANVNDPLNFSSYITAQQPNVTINAANVATPQQYANLAALNQLSGQNNQFLLPANASQAGTATPNLASFNYQQALNDLNQDLNTYNTNQLSSQQQALAALQAGIQGGGTPYNDQQIQNLINGAG